MEKGIKTNLKRKYNSHIMPTETPKSTFHTSDKTILYACFFVFVHVRLLSAQLCVFFVFVGGIGQGDRIYTRFSSSSWVGLSVSRTKFLLHRWTESNAAVKGSYYVCPHWDSLLNKFSISKCGSRSNHHGA